MKVLKDGQVYKATHVSGPRHSYLGLILSSDHDITPCVESVELGDDATDSKIEESKLTSCVQAGVLDGNHQCGTNYAVALIQYVRGDTWDEDVYFRLAKEIVIAAKGE